MPLRPPFAPQLREEDAKDPARLARILRDFMEQTATATREVIAELGGDGDDSSTGTGINTPHVKARRTGSNQTILDGTVTVVVFNSADWDTDGAYNTANGKFTAPADGYYRFSFAVGYTLASGPHILVTGLRKNGATYIGGIHTSYDQSSAAASYHDQTVSGTVALQLAAGDEIEVYGYQANGGASRLIRYADDVTFLEVQRVR